MQRPRARPRFRLELALAPEVVIERVRRHLEVDGSVTGALFRSTVLLTVRDEDTHFWSPHLDVQLEDGTDGGTLLTVAVASLGAMLFGGGFAYGAAYVGQGFGSEQMYVLRAFLDAALRDEP
jgi:hypothetical protein